MPSEFAHHWTLDPAVTFLNHASFGAAPREVLAVQHAWRDRIEAEPVRFFDELEAHLDEARHALGAFVGADPDDLAFVPNATAGMNTVLRSLRFRADDELLTTDHAYNAVKNAMAYVAERDGARVVIAQVPFPIGSADQVVEAILAAVTPHTRLAVLDHITSATALIFPIEQLTAELTRRGVDSLVDGAHAPGQVPLNVGELGATYYAANLHKWVCAPKGAGFLWVRPDRQVDIRPLAISHGANSPRTDRSRFRLEFDWTGTSDPSAYLAVPSAISFGDSLLAGGWDALRQRNHALVIAARSLACVAAGTTAPAPEAMIGSMASIPLPVQGGGGQVQGVELYGDPVHAHFLAHGIQTMVTPWPQRPDGGPWRRLVRISAAAYNTLGQYEKLATVIPGAMAVATRS